MRACAHVHTNTLLTSGASVMGAQAADRGTLTRVEASLCNWGRDGRIRAGARSPSRALGWRAYLREELYSRPAEAKTKPVLRAGPRGCL